MWSMKDEKLVKALLLDWMALESMVKRANTSRGTQRMVELVIVLGVSARSGRECYGRCLERIMPASIRP